MSFDYPTLLQSDSKMPPGVPSATPSATGEAVVDATTFRTVEIEQLFAAVNHAATRVGAAVLYRSLTQPLASVNKLHAKQEAVRELIADAPLREGLEDLLARASTRESSFNALLFGRFLGLAGRPINELEVLGYGYETYIKGTRFLLDIAKRARQLPQPKSAYLQDLLAAFAAFETSRACDLMKGPVYRTEKGIASGKEKAWYVPAIKFTPSLFKPVGLTVAAGLFLLALTFAPMLLDIAVSFTPAFILFLAPLAMLYAPVVGGFDRDACIYPLREIFKRSPEVQRSFDALGQLDELVAFIRFKDAFGHPVCLPTLLDAPKHRIDYRELRNPVLGKGNSEYVGNDLTLTDERLALVTGPNSGGKTAFCKTLAQSQVLAQIGCFVPAVQAELGVADHVFYQVPEISQLADGEGRFGAELRRTKEIFVTASSRSLVILDELSEGTTHEEKIEIATDVLNGFREKGTSTILITHNHQLVENFAKAGTCLTRQVEFKDDRPTYRLIEGISKVSHADRVARKIGFSKDDIARMLKGG